MAAILLAARTTTQQANTALSTKFAGKSADSFFLQHGPPASSYTMNDGRQIYVWAEQQPNFTIPGNWTSTVNVVGNSAYVNTTTTPDTNIAMQCQVRLVVSKSGTIEQILAQSDSMGVGKPVAATRSLAAERLGVEFIPENGGGAGVSLRKA